MNLDDQQDHRQWTQQHLDAADLRIPSIAPTPPQGENENDCMDVNVRGPGKATIFQNYFNGLFLQVYNTNKKNKQVLCLEINSLEQCLLRLKEKSLLFVY